MKRILLIFLSISICLYSFAAGIKSGPWTTQARPDGVTILWTSQAPGMAWVELSDGTRVWETFAGRRVFHRLHSIRIKGLTPGTVLRYRVCGQDLTDDSNARDPKFGKIYQGEWHNVRAFNPKAPECRFSVFNDIHMRTEEYSSLAAQVDSASTDFLFLNGDIVSAGNYDLDTYTQFTLDPLGNLPAGLPVFFARGNHEGRGNNVELMGDVFPSGGQAPFYYTFRQGPVAFIVFDAGETGKERSVLYSGKKIYEDYLKEQMNWAKRAMREPFFSTAPVKVCLLHVPMTDHKDKEDYFLQCWMNTNFLPILNKAGIDLMIGADLHEFMYCEKGSMNNDFPIIVNNEIDRLDFTYSDGQITLKSFHPDGTKHFERSFKPQSEFKLNPNKSMYDVTLISDTTENGIRKTSFQTCPAVCSVQIDIETEGNIIRKVKFTRGCHGNTQGVAKLCEGMKIDDVISRLEGIDCNSRGTSCPDQLARALKLLK